MKKIILAVMLAAAVMCPVGTAMAVFSTDDMTILEQKDIVALPDDKLIDTYVDVLAEMEASKAFHVTSGFTPKEYKKYKDLVKYRLRLILELHRRKLELPPELN